MLKLDVYKDRNKETNIETDLVLEVTPHEVGHLKNGKAMVLA